MSTLKRKVPYAALCLLGVLTSPTVISATQSDSNGMQDESLWNMSAEDLGEVRLTSIASGTETPLDKAAAVVTVITEKDIQAMGATDIDQVLETVPGLHVGRSDQTFFPKYNIRGITSTYNPETLMLINGIPITDLVFGNRGNVWGGMPVKSIARIEIIRGPGSALYGADAYAGVINIITKSRKDINGTIVGTGLGSFSTKSAWVEHGGTYGNNDVAFTLEATNTDGQKQEINADKQTQWDSIFKTNDSLAPGPVNTSVKRIDSRFDLQNGNFHLRAGYQGRHHIGTGPGVAQALDPKGHFASNRFNSDITYSIPKILSNTDAEARVSYYHTTQEVTDNIYLFPNGAFGGAFPNGFIGNPGYKEENARADFSLINRSFSNHIIRMGTGYFWGDVYQTTETKNFTPTFAPRANGLESVADTPEVWLPEKQRTSYYVLGQDEWQLAENWQLTSGVRFDHYSDFGDTTNPRIALVWATSDTITTKLLYGQAFRAPSISELYVISNPVSLGDPNLKPETLDNYELAFSHQLSSKSSYNLNVFYYKIKDYITLSDNGSGTKKWKNAGKRHGQGMEFEINYQPINTLNLLANYSFQKSKDETTNTDVGNAPISEVYLRSEWSFQPSWHFNTQVTHTSEQRRTAGDTRSPVKPYTLVDFTLRKEKVWKSLEASLSIHNAFNQQVLEPSPGPSPSIPGDFPMAGRSLYGELSYNF